MPIRRNWRQASSWLRLFAFAFVVCLPASAWSHGRSSDQVGSPNGITIPSLSHGQMAVIARYRSSILDLTSKQTPTDPVMRRLESYIDLQFFACAWGIVPGSIIDEESPFNECSHAYLAAVRPTERNLELVSA